MASKWPALTVRELEAQRSLLVQDGNHGAHRPRAEEKVANGIPHIRAADIDADGSIDFAGAEQLAESAWERIMKGRAQGGDVLLTHKGTVGRVGKAPENSGRFLCSPQTTLWRSLCHEVLDQRYLHCYLRSPRFSNQIMRIMHESDMAPYVSLTNQRELIIDLPPLPEQRAIASVVGALDEKIASNRRLVAFQIAVRERRFTHLHRRADRREPLATLAIQHKDTVQPSETPEETFEHFSIPAFDEGGDPEVCPGRSMASGKTRLPKEPVVLLSKLNPRTPRVWNPVANGFRTAVCSPELLVLRPAEGVTHAWVDACVRHDARFYDELLAGVTGTTGSRQRVKPADVMRATVPAPGPASIEEWTRFADPLIRREASLIRESRTLTATRDALLPKLVSGAIRVPLSNDPEEQVGAAVEALEK